MKIERNQGVLIIHFELSTLDTNNYNDFKNSLFDIIEGETKILLDIKTIQFIDSAGLGAILSILRKVHDNSGVVKMCGVSNSVKVLFELVRLSRLLDIYETEQDALASF